MKSRTARVYLPLARALSLASVLPFAFSTIGIGSVAGAECRHADTRDRPAQTPRLSDLTNVFREFASDMYTAGLDTARETEMRGLLDAVATEAVSSERLLDRFESTWLEAEREADELRRAMLCETDLPAADSASLFSVLDYGTAIETAVYRKHFILHAGQLCASGGFDFESVLRNYPGPIPRSAQPSSARLDGNVSAAREEIRYFCANEWEYEFVLPQPDGKHKRYRIEF